MERLRLIAVGNSLGVVLPRSLLAKLGASEGDILEAVETSDGIALTRVDPSSAMQIEAAEALMEEDRDVLKSLAK